MIDAMVIAAPVSSNSCGRYRFTRCLSSRSGYFTGILAGRLVRLASLGQRDVVGIVRDAVDAQERFVNKSDLIDQVAERTGQTKVAVAAMVEAAMDCVVGAVADGESVTLSGFGTFEPRQRKARTGRNPRTGEAVPIPPTTVPVFRPGNSFKSAVK